MERNSNLEHLWDFAMPKKKIGLFKKTDKAPLTRKQQMAAYNRDTGKSSLRKASEVPGAASKTSVNRMQLGGNLKSADAKAREFLESWLTQRQDILRQNLDDNRNYVEYYPKDGGAKAETDRQLMGSNSSNVEPYDFTQQEIDKNQVHNSILGSFDPGSRTVRINKELENAADPLLPVLALIHERTHALGSQSAEPLPQEKAIKKAHRKFDVPKPANEFEKYQDDKSEIYGRLMDARKRFGVSPKDTITKDDLVRFKNTPGYKDIGMERYPDEYILYLFNKIAKVNNKPKPGGLLYG